MNLTIEVSDYVTNGLKSIIDGKYVTEGKSTIDKVWSVVHPNHARVLEGFGAVIYQNDRRDCYLTNIGKQLIKQIRELKQ